MIQVKRLKPKAITRHGYIAAPPSFKRGLLFPVCLLFKGAKRRNSVSFAVRRDRVMEVPSRARRRIAIFLL